MSIAAEEIATAFDHAPELTVGVEEELMLLAPEGLDLVPKAGEVLARLGGDERFKLELPAAQIESVTTPSETVREIRHKLARARRDLAAACGGLVDLAAAGVHPTAAPEGELNRNERYDAAADRYGTHVLGRQLVFALQVHVAPGSADAALAVYNALRSYLPEIAGLAANAPFHGGRDTGFASVRPSIGLLLPRQGMPPAIASWAEFAESLEWGARANTFDRAAWWWELRPHVTHGTLELRVPDAQTTVADAAAVAAFGHCLSSWLCERHRSGEPLPVAPSWRIAENRWLAARDGAEARLVDLDSGEPYWLSERIAALVEELAPTAERLGCVGELARVDALARRNGAIRQREIATERGIGGVVEWLRAEFLVGCEAEAG